MLFVNTLLTSGTSMSISDGLSGILPFITKGFEFMTQEPMIYFVVLGILGGAIGIFGRAKAAAH